MRKQVAQNHLANFKKTLKHGNEVISVVISTDSEKSGFLTVNEQDFSLSLEMTT